MGVATYELFEQQAKEYGILDQFSKWDLEIAKKDADAGMQLLNYKWDYKNAKTDEERALINENAEALRRQFGYTGGTDGSGYYMDPITNANSPSAVSDEVQSAVDKVINYKPFTYDEKAPTHVSRNDGDIQNLKNEIINREPFTYDAASDPRFAQYKKQYTREGRRATEDAMGIAAAMTGGIPSSYAMTAAAQAGNQYAAALSDKIPELYEAAYNQYLNEHTMKIQDMDVLRALEESDYQKHRDNVRDFESNRNFAYDVWTGERDRLVGNADILKTMDDSKYNRFAEERAYQDQKEREEREERLALAEQALGVGDTKFLQALGIDTSLYDEELKRNAATEELKLALARDEAGDPSLLNAILQRGAGGTAQTLPLPEPKTVENTVLPEPQTSEFAFKDEIRVTYPSGYVGNQEDWDELVRRYGEEALSTAGVTFGNAPFATRDAAIKYMKENGVPESECAIDTRGDWEKHSSPYISYEKYLEAIVNEKVGKVKK